VAISIKTAAESTHTNIFFQIDANGSSEGIPYGWTQVSSITLHREIDAMMENRGITQEYEQHS
jgi:hypothetical protein